MLDQLVSVNLMSQGERSHTVDPRRYQFKNPKLLRLAFIHASASPFRVANHHMAWVGDSVLHLVITEALMAAYPQAELGQLSLLRQYLISRAACLKYAQDLKLVQYLRVGLSYKPQGTIAGRLLNASDNMLAELFEAVMGAIYADGGLLRARTFYNSHWPLPHKLEAAMQHYPLPHV